MNHYRHTRGGYTIIEVIIVLTVSSALFISALVTYNQQNRRTQFTESVNTFAQNIQDVLNDVETGFYPTTNGFSCSVSGTGAPTINTTVSANQGTNTDCIFVGRAIQFAPNASSSAANKSKMDIYTVVGRRAVAGSDQPVTSITEAQPHALSELSNLIEHASLVSGVQINAVKRADTNGNISGLAIVSTVSGGSAINTGLNSRASLAVVTGNTTNTSSATFINRVAALNATSVTRASKGIRICLQEQGSNREAVIELATGSSQTIVNVKIDTPCP